MEGEGVKKRAPINRSEESRSGRFVPRGGTGIYPAASVAKTTNDRPPAKASASKTFMKINWEASKRATTNRESGAKRDTKRSQSHGLLQHQAGNQEGGRA